MCGRYITPSEAALEREFSAVPASFNYVQSFNFAPSQAGLVVVDRDFSLRPMRWGFQPRWAKRAWINARSETVFESRAFARARRCLVPALGWYEWAGTRPKQPYYFSRRDGGVIAFAGIWTTGPDGADTYAILTDAADDLSAPIHDRMPVVLSPNVYDAWFMDLVPEVLRSIMWPGVADRGFMAYPVSTAVNSTKNNGPELIERKTG